MWRDLYEQIEIEFTRMEKLVERYSETIEQVKKREPNAIETDALATFLHSMYSAMENCLKRTRQAAMGELQSPGAWHTDLLTATTIGGPLPILSQQLTLRLRALMQFRHVFRHSYSFDLKWSKMAPLVLTVEQCFRDFQDEMRSFLVRQMRSCGEMQ